MTSELTITVHNGVIGAIMFDDKGMTTAEYAIGTLAAAGLATVLLVLFGSEWVTDMLRGLLQKAFMAGT